MAKKIWATTETSHQLLYKYTIAKIEKNKSLLTQQLLHLKRIGSMYCECPNKNGANSCCALRKLWSKFDYLQSDFETYVKTHLTDLYK